jgi:hypothetical protein
VGLRPWLPDLYAALPAFPPRRFLLRLFRRVALSSGFLCLQRACLFSLTKGFTWHFISHGHLILGNLSCLSRKDDSIQFKYLRTQVEKSKI